MIVELVDKLIDRCIQLVKHKQEISRNLFVDFVDPAYSNFENIHQNYLKTFRAYRTQLKDEQKTVDDLIDKMREDNLFSEGQRNKLKVLIDFSRDPIVGPFVSRVHEYLTNPYDFIPMHDGQKWRKGQRWRTTLIRTLEMIKTESLDNDKKTIEALDIIVEQMQELYTLVTQEYLELKRQLLA